MVSKLGVSGQGSLLSLDPQNEPLHYADFLIR